MYIASLYRFDSLELRKACGILQTCQNIVALKVRIVLKDLVDAHP